MTELNRSQAFTVFLAAVLTGCGAAPPIEDDEALEPRLVVLSREGKVASLGVAPPWTVHVASDLKVPIASARCRGHRCVVIHPAPDDAVTVLDPRSLSLLKRFEMEPGADPRDAVFIDDDTVVVSQYERAELLVLDLATGGRTAIDLGPLSDEDGLPEAMRLASCGSRVFVQLGRVDHRTGEPSLLGPALGVIDLSVSGRLVDADPTVAGVQAIALAGPPAFDMPVDCEDSVLYVSEPEPLMSGGGGYEQVDLESLVASELPLDIGAEVGGFEVVAPSLYWIITHTEFGPGASSHLELVGDIVTPDTHNTFSGEFVNELALDREEGLLFFPDPCEPLPTFDCATGVHVFHAKTGRRAQAEPVDVGFAPVEVVLAR